jgi:hypothetical protein
MARSDRVSAGVLAYCSPGTIWRSRGSTYQTKPNGRCTSTPSQESVVIFRDRDSTDEGQEQVGIGDTMRPAQGAQQKRKLSGVCQAATKQLTQIGHGSPAMNLVKMLTP